MSSLPPALIMIAGAALALAVPNRLRGPVTVAVPLVVLGQMVWVLEPGDAWYVGWLSLELMPLRVDKLSLVFGYVFALAAVGGGLYAWHKPHRIEQSSALIYAGTAIGIVFAGDLLTLVVFWEIMALSATYLVWSGARERYPGSSLAVGAGTRYLFVHLVGGTLLLGGVSWHLGSGGGMAFDAFSGGPGAWLIVTSFAISAAIPPLHAWLTDSYPEASITGAVFLSAFTTKAAVYALARGFPGLDILVYVGVAMAIYGVVYAVLENDIRRLLAYHIVSQVGFMVAAIGIGTDTAINGAVAHAFAHVTYKGLLFMGVGAVIYATGRRTLTDLGGIGGRMPAVVALYMVGALSISAFPLFSGFVSKSLVIFAAEEEGLRWVVLGLYVASVGTFLHTGLKLPFFVWFDRPTRTDLKMVSVPWGMYAGMGLAAFVCVAIGVFPELLYDRLPFENHYAPYTTDHVLRALQLLAFTLIGFWLFVDRLSGERAVAVDTDWFYRKAGTPARVLVLQPLEAIFTVSGRAMNQVVRLATEVAMEPKSTLQKVLGLWSHRGLDRAEALSDWLERPPLGFAVAMVVVVWVVITMVWY